jgi:hypothetical protein
MKVPNATPVGRTETVTEHRTMSVLLNITVEALQGEELDAAGFNDCLGDDEEDEMTNLITDYSAAEIARLLPFAITHPDNEMFAGSGFFVKLSDVTVIKSEWAPQ